jgi:hypothetical protein
MAEPLPSLAGFRNDGAVSIRRLRALTEEEHRLYTDFLAVAVKARNRFRMFKLLELNYRAWDSLIKALLRPETLHEDEMLELDRMLLNFLTSARALLDHFTQYYVQAHRGTAEENKFRDYLETLTTKKWAFAFFQDFRNFIQHCGLGVCNYSKHVGHRSVELKVEADAVWLLQHYNRWTCSNLQASHGKLDLITLVQEYYFVLIHSVGPFLARAFFPKLVDAHNFFATMGKEVGDAAPGHGAVLLSEFKPLTTDGERLNVQMTQIVTDVFGDVGIKVEREPNPGCN